MKWNIIIDSSCDIMQIPELSPNAEFSKISFIINIGDTNYIDDENINISEMMDNMEKSSLPCSTACPPPSAWEAEFLKADYSIAITVSDKISGWFNSAQLAKKNVLNLHPEKQIHIIDSHSAGAELVIIAERINELIKKGLSFPEVVKKAEECAEQTHIMFVVSSFDNLMKSGRISKIVGFIAGKLGMRVIRVGTDDGTIAMKHKTRTDSKLLALLISEMKEKKFNGDRIVICNCFNPKLTEALRKEIEGSFKNTEISIIPTGGLCSYYVERSGFIVAF